MATNDDMNIYKSEYTGKQIDTGLSIIYQEKGGIKSIPPNVFFATNEKGEANPISTNTIINIDSLENKLQNYVTLDSRQTIEGAKTFMAGASFYQSDDSNLSMNINGKGVAVVNSGSQGMGSLSLDWHSIQISTPSGDGELVFGFNSSEKTRIAFPPTSGTVALLSDIPFLPTNYVTLGTDQTISGVKTFSGNKLEVTGGGRSIALSAMNAYGAPMFTSYIDGNTTQVRFPNKSGVFALTDDLPAGETKVQLGRLNFSQLPPSDPRKAFVLDTSTFNLQDKTITALWVGVSDGSVARQYQISLQDLYNFRNNPSDTLGDFSFHLESGQVGVDLYKNSEAEITTSYNNGTLNYSIPMIVANPTHSGYIVLGFVYRGNPFANSGTY